MPLFEGHVPHINDLFDKRTGTGGVLNRAILRPPQHWRLYFMNEGQIGKLPGVVGEHYHRTIGTLNDAGIKPLVAGITRAQRIEELIGVDYVQAYLLAQIDLDDPLRIPRYGKGVRVVLDTLAHFDGVHTSELKLGPVVSLSADQIRERIDLLADCTPREKDAYVSHLKAILGRWDLTLAA